MTDLEYIELARRNSTWQDIVASFAIEGMVLTEQNEIIAGKMIAGTIDSPEAIRLIVESAGITKPEDQGCMIKRRGT